MVSDLVFGLFSYPRRFVVDVDDPIPVQKTVVAV
jgi:hypothetical protein